MEKSCRMGTPRRVRLCTWPFHYRRSSPRHIMFTWEVAESSREPAARCHYPPDWQGSGEMRKPALPCLGLVDARSTTRTVHRKNSEVAMGAIVTCQVVANNNACVGAEQKNNEAKWAPPASAQASHTCTTLHEECFDRAWLLSAIKRQHPCRLMRWPVFGREKRIVDFKKSGKRAHVHRVDHASSVNGLTSSERPALDASRERYSLMTGGRCLGERMRNCLLTLNLPKTTSISSVDTPN